MTRQSTLLALTGFVLAAPLALSAQNSDQQPSPAVMHAVKAAFPNDLRYAKEPASENDYYTCAAVFSRDANGAPDLIAAGYDGDRAGIAMLRYNSSTATIVDLLKDKHLWFVGGPCEASVVNLADSAQPDSFLARTVKISFGGSDWFFTWDGKKLQNITALYHESGPSDVPNSDMARTSVVDIDHIGPMQIDGQNGDSDKFLQDDGISSTGTDTLFRYNGTTYARAKTCQYLEQYEPNLPKSNDDLAAYKTDASPWTQEINMHKTPALSYQLTVVNGDRSGSNRVTSAKVEINGLTIVLPSEVNEGVEMLTRKIQLQKENEIKVTVDGPAKSYLYVIVE